MGTWRMLDLFPKIPTDLSQSTAVGGWFSTVTGVLMLLLFQIELFSFISAPLESYIVVDNVMETKLQINFNMSFLDLSCEYLTVDARDVLGTNRVNITGQEVQKWHLDPDGVKKAFHGRNRKQKDIAKFDKKITATLEELHEDGVHAEVLTEDTFAGWLKSHDVTLVAFHAPWCGWCKQLMPTLEVLAEAVAEDAGDIEISIATVDCTTEVNICKEQFGIRAFPTLKLFLEDNVQPPDYAGHRTVSDLLAYVLDKASTTTMKHKRISRKVTAKQESVHDDKLPGCMVSGHIEVNRVPGSFHIEAASKSQSFDAARTNLSHIVHHMSFGLTPPYKIKNRLDRLPEELRQATPLNGNVYIANEYHQAPHHYIKVVGSTYELASMRVPWYGYQMVANSQMMLYETEDVPEAKFSYNLSPMAVLVKSEKQPWYGFITKVLAIVGGTLSVFGLVDAAVYRASRKRGQQLN